MELHFFCPRWGSEHLDYEIFFEKVSKAGYQGVEFSLPLDEKEKAGIIELLKSSGLQFIAQHWETNTRNFELHKNEYRMRLLNLLDANPLFINTHTGKDYFTFEQNLELLAIAEEVSRDWNVRIMHETHRGRFSFAIHEAVKYFEKLTNLRIAVDFSHWCNVAESYLEDQVEEVELAISRADHIHARVGFPEGPQIPDPRAPEWEKALDVHVTWWKKIFELKKRQGERVLTITPEFGPYPYMQILPHSKEPIADQWDINVFMMKFLQQKLK